MPKSRAEINRQNYERNKAARQEKARLRMREIRQSWRQAMIEWDAAHEWSEPPADWACTGLSQSAISMAFTNPADMDWDEEDDRLAV